MKTGVRIESISYITNEEKKTTVCLIKASSKYESFEVKGIAKCSPDDDFNVAIGRRVAESRAKKNLYDTVGKYWMKFADMDYKRYMKFLGMSSKCKMLADKEREHIKELCNV